MKSALIFGSTGLIGHELLQILLENDHYDKVIALTRKPLELQHDKLEEVQYDFENPDKDLVIADHIFCCLGTTIRNAGSQKRFYRIDHDYVVETAKFAKQGGATLFSLVSAIGADPKSRVFYNKVKGEIEIDIEQIGFAGLHIFRPSMLLGNRKEFRLMEFIAKIMMQWFSFLIPPKYRGVQGSKVAAVMAAYAAKFADKKKFVSNDEIIEFKLN